MVRLAVPQAVHGRVGAGRRVHGRVGAGRRVLAQARLREVRGAQDGVGGEVRLRVREVRLRVHEVQRRGIGVPHRVHEDRLQHLGRPRFPVRSRPAKRTENCSRRAESKTRSTPKGQRIRPGRMPRKRRSVTFVTSTRASTRRRSKRSQEPVPSMSLIGSSEGIKIIRSSGVTHPMVLRDTIIKWARRGCCITSWTTSVAVTAISIGMGTTTPEILTSGITTTIEHRDEWEVLRGGSGSVFSC